MPARSRRWSRMVRPHVALVTTIAPVHIEHLGSLEAIADAKAEIFAGLEPGGVAVLNRDAPQFERLAAARAGARARVVTFGADAACDAQLIEVAASTAARAFARRVARPRARFHRSARRARTWPRTRLACCSPARRWAPTSRDAAAALAEFAPQQGRGARLDSARRRRPVHPDRRELQRQSRLDARRAGAAGRGRARRRRPAHRGARRHAGTRSRRRGACTPPSRPNSRAIASICCLAPDR